MSARNSHRPPRERTWSPRASRTCAGGAGADRGAGYLGASVTSLVSGGCAAERFCVQLPCMLTHVRLVELAHARALGLRAGVLPIPRCRGQTKRQVDGDGPTSQPAATTHRPARAPSRSRTTTRSKCFLRAAAAVRPASPAPITMAVLVSAGAAEELAATARRARCGTRRLAAVQRRTAVGGAAAGRPAASQRLDIGAAFQGPTEAPRAASTADWGVEALASPCPIAAGRPK